MTRHHRERAEFVLVWALLLTPLALFLYLRGYGRRVCELTVAIGTELGLTPSRLRAASDGALRHDVGKIGSPDAVPRKSGKLDDHEHRLAVMDAAPELLAHEAGRQLDARRVAARFAAGDRDTTLPLPDCRAGEGQPAAQLAG